MEGLVYSSSCVLSSADHLFPSLTLFKWYEICNSDLIWKQLCEKERLPPIKNTETVQEYPNGTLFLGKKYLKRMKDSSMWKIHLKHKVLSIHFVLVWIP